MRQAAAGVCMDHGFGGRGGNRIGGSQKCQAMSLLLLLLLLLFLLLP